MPALEVYREFVLRYDGAGVRQTMISENAAAILEREGLRRGQRTAPGVEALVQSFLDNLLFVQGRSVERATLNDLYMALAHTVRDRLVRPGT